MFKKYYLFVLILVCLSFSFCKQQTSITMYQYTDQNNNIYTISETGIKYNPISPNESSSGVYSGGKKDSVVISKEQFIEISSLVNSLIQNTENQISRREMMTSVLIKDSIKVILKPSKERIKFETKLLQFLIKD